MMPDAEGSAIHVPDVEACRARNGAWTVLAGMRIACRAGAIRAENDMIVNAAIEGVHSD